MPVELDMETIAIYSEADGSLSRKWADLRSVWVLRFVQELLKCPEYSGCCACPMGPTGFIPAMVT